MDMAFLTKLVLIVTIVLLILYNLVVLYIAGPDATISRVAYQAAQENPFLVFALGFILGHILWPL
jgi:hypothetical protein